VKFRVKLKVVTAGRSTGTGWARQC